MTEYWKGERLNTTVEDSIPAFQGQIFLLIATNYD